MKQPLSALIRPHSKSDFFDHYESNTPLVVHELGDSIHELTALPFLESLETVLASWPKKVDAYLPGIADEGNSTEVTTEVRFLRRDSIHELTALPFLDR